MRHIYVRSIGMLCLVLACGCSGGGKKLDGSLSNDAAGIDTGNVDAGNVDAGAADLPPAACPAPKVRCGDQCVDIQSDPAHCGGCNAPCAPPKICQNSTCQEQTGDCSSGTPCPQGYYCDLGDGKCKPGCASDQDCGALATCDLVSNTCKCVAGAHLCGSNTCVGNNDVNSCGSSCVPCPAPAHGQPTCDGTNCGIQCDGGYHLCGNACLPNNSVASCGSSCTPCPTTSHGIATCNGTSCGIQCDGGYHLCGNACLSNNSVASCGSSCTPCPTSAHGTATCNGTSCGIQCDAGYHLCGTTCLANNSVASCGSSCTPCPVPANGAATCDGTSCGVQCNSGFHLCGSACLSDTSVASCGSSCTPCPTTSHGTATCVAGSCGFFCDAGYYPCPTGCAAINVDIQVAATSSTDKLGINLDMALTSSGHPVILYADTGYHDHIVVWNGSSWSATAYAAVPMPYYYCKLALDSADMPHLACKDYYKDILHYLRWVSGAWVAEQVDSGSSFVDKPDIAVDSSNGVHFAYWNGYGLKYAKRQSGGGFTIEAVLSAPSVPYPSLAVDSAGVPSVAVGFLNTGLRVATRDGAPWNIKSIEPTTSVGSVSLTVDSQKRPHVSYTALPGGDVVLKHVMRSGTSWPIQVVEQAPSIYMTAIATDASDRAIIGYFKVASSQYALQIARWDGQAWRLMQVDPGGGSYAKLAAAVDGQGVSHLAFPRTSGSFTGEIDHAVITWPTCP